MNKPIWVLLLPLLIAGCGGDDRVLTEHYENGQKSREISVKNGEYDGPVTFWYENGRKSAEGHVTPVNGKKGFNLVSLVAWKPNGEKCPLTDVKNGNGIWVCYRDDGTEEERVTVKDGDFGQRSY